MQPASVGESFPRLLADIGGTNVRFALEQRDGTLAVVSVRAHAGIPSISDAIQSYLSRPQAIAAGARSVRHAALAIANPIKGDWVQMTNANWAFSIQALREQFGLDTLLLVNDFSALASAVPLLGASQVCQVGNGHAVPGKPVGVIGPGTGLGVSGLIPGGTDWIVLEAEGGHVSFAPMNEREMEVLRFAWKRYPHVSAERLVSGGGLELIHQALAAIFGDAPETLTAPEITRRALAGECARCDETVEMFCEMLGTVASNLALTLGAMGGIYLGGGIVPRLGKRFEQSGFRRRFEQKGRFSSYLADIPTFVITAENPAFLGVSAMLARALA